MLVDADYIARSGTSLEIVNLVVFEVDSENENIIANISEKFVIALSLMGLSLPMPPSRISLPPSSLSSPL